MESTKTPRSRRIVAALLFPLLFLLTACELSMDVTVNEDDTAATSMVMALPKDGPLPVDDMNCDQLAAEMKNEAGGEDVTVEDQSDDEFLRCKMTGKAEPISELGDQGFKISREGDNYVVAIEPDESMGDMGMLGAGMKVTVAFHFPGAVQKVDTTLKAEDYTIDGNTVTFTSLDFFGAGTTITAAASGGGASATLWWILGIVLVLIILAIIAVVVMKKKQGAAPADPNSETNVPQSPVAPPAQDGVHDYAATQTPNTPPVTPHETQNPTPGPIPPAPADGTVVDNDDPNPPAKPM